MNIMSTDKKPDPAKDISKPGREEDPNADHKDPGPAHITNLPGKDDKARNETEGERRFKEGLVNNSDMGEGSPS
jgi:hypothetical protein